MPRVKNFAKEMLGHMDAAERRSLIADEFIRSFEERTLTFVYQPIVRLEDGHITGAEVLLRWICPGIGPVNPLVMISVAEEYGLAARLGEWAMREACAQNRMWRTQSLGRLRLHLNVSNIELRNVGFAPLLASVCAASGLAPSDVALEVHEMWSLADDLPALAALRDARALGATIVADDVNEQLADQSWLDAAPIDVLKLNRTFVSELPMTTRSLPKPSARWLTCTRAAFARLPWASRRPQNSAPLPLWIAMKCKVTTLAVRWRSTGLRACCSSRIARSRSR
jgi:EAL domain-containing protein (putative c-di-GMP-specific phosphodiesterase class I)